jgi:undecaprenyl-diphosphatase
MTINNNSGRLFTARFWVLVALSLISGLLFLWLAWEVISNKGEWLDTLGWNFVQAWTSPLLTKIALLVTFGGTNFFTISIYLAILFYLFKKNYKRAAIHVFVIASSSILLGWLLKLVFQRQRPNLLHLQLAIGYSFPSGHTLGAFTLCGILVYMTLKTEWSSIAKLVAVVLLLLYACLVGLSRIYLHVHFTSDVIASMLVALWWLTLSLICIKLTDRLAIIKRKQDSPNTAL